MSLAGGVDGLIISGLSAFLPKFIEQQYQISNGVAAQLVGLIVVPAGGGGTFFGGWLIKRLNLSRHGIILMCLLSQMITIPTIFVYFMTCSGPDYVGLSLPSSSQVEGSLPVETYFPTHSPSDSSSPFISSCNAACSCPEAAYDPVCLASVNLRTILPQDGMSRNVLNLNLCMVDFPPSRCVDLMA